MRMLLALMLLCLTVKSDAARLVIKRGDVTKGEVTIDGTVEITPATDTVTVSCAASPMDATSCRETITIITPPPVVIPPPVTVCPSVWTGYPWASHTRRAMRFPQLRLVQGGYSGDFPHFGGATSLQAGPNEYLTVEFDATSKRDLNGDGVVDVVDYDSMSKVLSWIESQQGGASTLNGTYVTISRCPGDLRLPGMLPSSTEPTLAQGCRNVSGSFVTAGIEYGINVPSSNSVCGLTYGSRYYLNFTAVNPLDGWQVGEHNCDYYGGDGRCGVQVQSQ